MGSIGSASEADNRNTLGLKIEGNPKIGHKVDGSASALNEIFGTENEKHALDLFAHCIKALNKSESGNAGEVNDERTFMLAIIKDIAPRDAVERMLAIQMAATHVATIRSARWLANAETIPQVQAHYTGFNKLTRSYTAQVEALRKHRTGGKQTVVIQHVNVEDGGQAIVGNVQTRGEGSR